MSKIKVILSWQTSPRKREGLQKIFAIKNNDWTEIETWTNTMLQDKKDSLIGYKQL